MKYKIERFFEESATWYTISSGNCLELMIYRMKCYKKDFPENHYRVIKVIEVE